MKYVFEINNLEIAGAARVEIIRLEGELSTEEYKLYINLAREVIHAILEYSAEERRVGSSPKNDRLDPIFQSILASMTAKEGK